MPGLREMVQFEQNHNLAYPTLSQKFLSHQTNPSQHTTTCLGLHTGGRAC